MERLNQLAHAKTVLGREQAAGKAQPKAVAECVEFLWLLSDRFAGHSPDAAVWLAVAFLDSLRSSFNQVSLDSSARSHSIFKEVTSMPSNSDTLRADRAERAILLIRVLVGWVFLSEEFRNFCFQKRWEWAVS